MTIEEIIAEMLDVIRTCNPDSSVEESLLSDFLNLAKQYGVLDLTIERWQTSYAVLA